MATMITSECINCGACEPECPNTAIYQGGVEWQAPDGSMHPPLSNDIFYIVPEKCTECVGFYDHEACAAVCPVDCCVPNPDIPEAESVLLARARALHPDKTIADDAPSRFRKEGAAPAAQPNGLDAAPAAPAPAVAAAPPKAAVAAPAPTPAPAAGARGRVERPLTPPPARPRPAFAGEIGVDFDALLAEMGAPRRRVHSRLARTALLVLAATQGILGACPAGVKQRLEAAIGDRRWFDAGLATAANVFLNLVLYPVLCVAWAVVGRGVELFSNGVHRWIFLGIVLAVVEAAVRLRESLFRGVPFSEAPLRAAVYGPLVVPFGLVVARVAGARGAASSVGFDGFYAGREHFDEKRERDRRYGSIYRLEERHDAYILRLEFPRRVPPSSLGDELGLPPEMPDYDYELSLEDGAFVVRGRVADPVVRRLTGVAPAFPSEFTTRVPLRDRVAGFRHRYRDKTLEVILPKAE